MNWRRVVKVCLVCLVVTWGMNQGLLWAEQVSVVVLAGDTWKDQNGNEYRLVYGPDGNRYLVGKDGTIWNKYPKEGAVLRWEPFVMTWPESFPDYPTGAPPLPPDEDGWSPPDWDHMPEEPAKPPEPGTPPPPGLFEPPSGGKETNKEEPKKEEEGEDSSGGSEYVKRLEAIKKDADEGKIQVWVGEDGSVYWRVPGGSVWVLNPRDGKEHFVGLTLPDGVEPYRPERKEEGAGAPKAPLVPPKAPEPRAPQFMPIFGIPKEFETLRTGRATPPLVEQIPVATIYPPSAASSTESAGKVPLPPPVAPLPPPPTPEEIAREGYGVSEGLEEEEGEAEEPGQSPPLGPPSEIGMPRGGEGPGSTVFPPPQPPRGVEKKVEEEAGGGDFEARVGGMPPVAAVADPDAYFSDRSLGPLASFFISIVSARGGAIDLEIAEGLIESVVTLFMSAARFHDSVEEHTNIMFSGGRAPGSIGGNVTVDPDKELLLAFQLSGRSDGILQVTLPGLQVKDATVLSPGSEGPAAAVPIQAVVTPIDHGSLVSVPISFDGANLKEVAVLVDSVQVQSTPVTIPVTAVCVEAGAMVPGVPEPLGVTTP